MLNVAVSLPAPRFWLPAFLCIFSDHPSKTLSLSAKGVTQGNSSSFPFHISLLQVQDVMSDGSCPNERVWRFHWLHWGQNSTLGDLLEKWEGISIFTENLQPLIVLKLQIFSSQGKVHLLFQMNVVAERHLLLENLWKLLKTKAGIKEKQGGKGLCAIKHQHKPSWAFCLCPSPFLFTHSSSSSGQPQNANFSNHLENGNCYRNQLKYYFKPCLMRLHPHYTNKVLILPFLTFKNVISLHPIQLVTFQFKANTWNHFPKRMFIQISRWDLWRNGFK